jgi:phytoene dehydrogenase-like protein
MGVASPFLRSLSIDIPWIEPTAPCAHPLDDGTAVMLEHSIGATIANLDACDHARYRSLIEPLVLNFAELSEDILAPIQHFPRHPFLLARFGSSALLPAASLAVLISRGNALRLYLPVWRLIRCCPWKPPISAAVGLILIAAGQTSGWPILHGGAQALPDALSRHL